MTRKQAIELLVKHPAKLGRSLGFTLLTDDLHNGWIRDMVTGKEDETLQAHRGSYKTTCVSLALAIIMILFPNLTTLFLRKTDPDVKEVVEQVRKILLSSTIRVLVWVIWGVELQLTVSNALEISTTETAQSWYSLTVSALLAPRPGRLPAWCSSTAAMTPQLIAGFPGWSTTTLRTGSIRSPTGISGG